MAVKFKDTININGQYTLPEQDGTVDQVLSTDGAGIISFVDLPDGEAVKIACKNTTASTITKGTPVYITGTVGTSFIVQVAPADASNSAKMPAVGLLETDLAANGEGFIVTGGLLKNLTTDPIDGTTPSSNDTIYVKSGGGLTMTKPTGSNLIQNIGKVGRVNSSNAGSIVVSSILRTNDVPNLTEGKIWVGSADNTIESTVVHIDETNTRIGINQNTPDVTLDITGTDAIQIPKGTDAERPTPESGMLRFNTTSAEFEGYNGTEWGAIGGSEVASVDVDSFTGDGTTVNYTLTSEIPDEKTTQVYIDGVYQSKGNYSVSGTTLTFSTAPPNGTAIEVVHFTAIAESTLNGSGTANYVTKWQDADTLANSIIFDNGTNIGIGTASPTNAKLEVNGEGLIGNGTNGIKLSYSNGNSTGILDTGYSSTGLEFRTGNVFRMELNSTGLGIGTNTPTKDLHISSTSGTKAMFERTGATGAYIGLKDSSGSLVYLGNNNGTFEVQTAGSSYSTKLAVTSAGNVGIGTDSPDAVIHANVSTAGANIAKFSDPNNRALIIEASTEGMKIITTEESDETDSDRALIFQRGNVETMRIDSSGNVGITNSTPSSYNSAADNLVIGTTGDTGMTIASGNTNQGSIFFADGTTGGAQQAAGYLLYYHNDNYMAFGTSNTERMRIDSSGVVQVRNQTPTIQLYNTDDGLALNQTLGDIDWYQIDPSDQGVGTVAKIRAVNNSTFAGYGELAFHTGNATTLAERMRITSGGDVYAYEVYNRTTGISANMYIHSDGLLHRSTSSIKYKTNVQDYDKGIDTIMQLRPVSYEGLSETDSGKTYAGFIAEEIHEAGLTEFVQYDSENNPDALSYGAMVSLLTKAMQEQQEIINDLKARIETLENQ